MAEEQLTIKVVLIGDSGVGKTCIINRFIQDKYVNNVTPNSSSTFVTKNLKFDEYGGKTVKLEVWDTCGHEQYRSLGKIFYKGAGAAILVYEITNKNSFKELKEYWYKQIKDYAPQDINKF
jgi:small GTP-binding protein